MTELEKKRIRKDLSKILEYTCLDPEDIHIDVLTSKIHKDIMAVMMKMGMTVEEISEMYRC